MTRFLIDYEYKLFRSSGIEGVEADTAQEAVNEFLRYMPADGLEIRGVYKAVRNWSRKEN